MAFAEALVRDSTVRPAHRVVGDSSAETLSVERP
jgi:hypothetical protein